MKKLASILLGIILTATAAGCTEPLTNGLVAYQFQQRSDYYQGDTFRLRLEDYFENNRAATTYTATHGTVDEAKMLSVLLVDAGTLLIEVTAKNSERDRAVLKIELEVKANIASNELFGDSTSAEARLYGARAVELLEIVTDKYWQDASSLAWHYYPNSGDPNGDNSTAFVWPYTEYVASVWRIVSQRDASEKLNALYKKVLDGFAYYRSYRSDYHAYAAVRSNRKGEAAGDHYYDDNIWIAREFLNAFEVLGTASYLETAKSVSEYVWSGWADDEIGGIYWCESGESAKKSRNACSNAPAVILFARLYQQTGEAKWLERAKKCYDFCYEYLKDPNGVYWDNISNAGAVQNWQFTYNTGSMISAGVKLYEVTEDAKYLEHAKSSAEGAYNRFFHEREGFDYRKINSHNPWFNVLLLDGYIELYHHEPDVLPYLEAYEKNLCYGYENFRSPDGFMSANWVEGFSKNGEGELNHYHLNILDMAGNSENFGQLAYFYENVKSYT